MIKRLVPAHARGDPHQHFFEFGIAHRGAGRMFIALAQDVATSEFKRVDLQRAGNDVGMTFVGPHQLRNAKAAKRTGRRQVGVDLG